MAHSCAGASATLGMVQLVPMLRELEKQGASGTLTVPRNFAKMRRANIKAIKNFMAVQPGLAATAADRQMK